MGRILKIIVASCFLLIGFLLVIIEFLLVIAWIVAFVQGEQGEVVFGIVGFFPLLLIGAPIFVWAWKLINDEIEINVSELILSKIGLTIIGTVLTIIILSFLLSLLQKGYISKDVGKAIEIVIIGGLLIGGSLWQIYLLRMDGYKIRRVVRIYRGVDRILLPVIFDVMIIIGVIGYGIIALFDAKRSDYTLSLLFADFLKVLTLSISFVIKSYFAPIFLSITMSVIVYNTNCL